MKKLLWSICLSLLLCFMLGTTVFASSGTSIEVPTGDGTGAIASSYGCVGYGFRIFLCKDAGEITNSDGILLQYPDILPKLDSIADQGKCFHLFSIASQGDVFNYSTGKRETWMKDDISSFYVPNKGGGTIPFQFQGGLKEFNAPSYAKDGDTGYLNDHYTWLTDAEEFKNYVDSLFGVSWGDASAYENAVIIFEPFTVWYNSMDNFGYLIWTWQKCIHSVYEANGGGAPILKSNYKQNLGSGSEDGYKALGVQRDKYNCGSYFDDAITGKNLLTGTRVRECGAIKQRVLKGVLQTIDFFSTGSGFVCYGPGAGGAPPSVTPAYASADIYLQEWELNHIFPSMMSKSALVGNMANGLQVNKDQFSVPTGVQDSSHSCGATYKTLVSTTKNYNVKIKESSASGIIVMADNTALSRGGGGVSNYLLRSSASAWTRSQLKSAVSVDTEDKYGGAIDYGVDLIRPWFKDNSGTYDIRVISSLSPSVANESFIISTLKLSKGCTPFDVATVSMRSKHNILLDTTLIDTFNYRGTYVATTGTTHYCSDTETVTCGTAHKSAADPTGTEHSATKYKVKTGCHSFEPFWVKDSEAKSEFDFTLVSQAYKYWVQLYYGASVNERELNKTPTSDSNGSDSTNEYKFAIVRDIGKVVNYYPEVPMVAYVPNLDGDGNVTGGTEVVVPTIGEELRSSNSPMLLMYRVKDGAKGIRGNVYSDTAVGGTASQNTGGVVALTAGGDFTVKIESSASINLYGYCLDLLQSGDSEWASRTNSINIKSEWGSPDKSEFRDSYITWASAMLSPRNYQADLRMRLSSATYDSFTATVGKFSKGVSNPQESTYALMVRHGVVEHDGSYNDLIYQIASDYGVSTAEAEQLFINSGIPDAILSAIESDITGSNDSASGVSALGNSNHWYDENVKYLCVRRFAVEGIFMQNVITQDKLDIGSSSNESAVFNNSTGQFDLTLWFTNKDVLGLDTVEVYNPNRNNLNVAINGGNVIFANVHVQNADFKVTQSTTSTGSR